METKAPVERGNTRTTRKSLEGIVVSDKGDKTIVVRVDRTIVHPKYGKRYVQSKKFHAHDEGNEYAVGEKVTIYACRPLSKNKAFRVKRKSQESQS